MRPQPMHLDGMPPLHVPFRFYLTAPLFGAAAAALLLLEPAAWQSRWTDATVAAVHLLVLGFFAMVMVGSLFQVIPVLGGRAVAQARRVAPVVHLALTAGTVLLGAALLRPTLAWWPGVLALYGLGFGLFLAAVGWTLTRRGVASDSIFVIRLALLALLVAVGYGLFFAACRAWPGLAADYRALTHVHLTWGVAGWIALLVMGVSFQVIPMFQVAPAFHPRLARGTALALFLGLAGLVVAGTRGGPVYTAAATVIAAALVTYAVHALSVLARRRRKRADALNRFWQLSLASLCATAALGWALACTPLSASSFAPRAELLLGALAFVGFVMSVMVGMLLKIAAFLAFLHLQRRCLLDVSVAHLLPTMDAFVGERGSRVQLGLHAATIAAVVTAALWPAAGAVAAALLAADFACLWWLLATATARYFVAADTIAFALAQKSAPMAEDG